MSFVGKAKAKVEEIMGEFKESVGEAYGNEALELDGEAEAEAAREREAELEAGTGHHPHVDTADGPAADVHRDPVPPEVGRAQPGDATSDVDADTQPR